MKVNKVYRTVAEMDSDLQSNQTTDREKKWEDEARMAYWNEESNLMGSLTPYSKGYLRACKVRQEEIERLKEACHKALRFGTFHQINEELEAKKFIEEVLKAK